MRLPFIQVDQDALVRARTMAGLLKIPHTQGVGIAVSLFAWALEMTDSALTGQIADESPAEVVAAAVDWTGDPGKLYAALCRVGFIEKTSGRVEDGFDRVRGLGRYAEALSLPEKRREAGKLGAESRWGKRKAKAWQADGKQVAKAWQPDDKHITNDGQTHTHTQKQTQNKDEEELSSPPAPKESFPVVWEKPATEPDNWTGLEFFAWAQAKRRDAGLQGEKPPHPRKLSAWFSTAQMSGVSVGELQEAFYAFGDDKHWQNATPPLPFQAFMSQWQKYLPRGVSHAAS